MMDGLLTQQESYLLPNETMYVCGSAYFGLRDDVPRECWGCASLKSLRRHPAFAYRMPCQNRKEGRP